MAEYEVLYSNLLSGRIIGRLPFTSLSMSFDRNQPGSFTVAIPLNSTPSRSAVTDGEIEYLAQEITTDTLGPAKTGLGIRRNGLPIFGGIIWALNADVESDTLVISGSDFSSYLYRVNIQTTTRFNQIDQALIANRLADIAVYGQGVEFLTTPSEDDLTLHGVPRDRVYLGSEYKNLGEAINQLSAVEDGFDYDFVPAVEGDKLLSRMNLTYPNTGRWTPYTLEIGRNVSVLSYEISGTDYANFVHTLGSATGEESVTATAFDLTAPYPFYDYVQTFSDVIRKDTLQDHANAILRNKRFPAERLTLSTLGGVEPEIGSYRVGDVMKVVGKSGAIAVDGYYRLVSFTTSVAGNGTERVSMELLPWSLFTDDFNIPTLTLDGFISPVLVTPPSVTYEYQWENRDPYIEPNPNAALGTPEKTIATLLGLTSRMVISSVAEFNTATTTATPGTQLYFDTTLVGNGTSALLAWNGTHAAYGAGSAVSGTPANPILWTCAPGVWIDGGQAAGAEDLSSRCIQIRGAKHVGLYGVNARRANFVAKFDQCEGSFSAPIIVRYSTFAEAGHSLLHFGGYFAVQAGDRVGETNYADVRYCEFRDAGLANNRFGEAIYTGWGSGPGYHTSQCHDITVEANWIHDCPAEAFDAKPGGYNQFFRYNLITDCGDSQVRSGSAANEGFPGSVQMYPANDFGYPAGYTTMPPGYVCNSEVIGNRFLRISSVAAKFPQAQIVLSHRGIKCIGNVFEDCDVPSTNLIMIYIEDAQSFGTNGTFEVHNNTTKTGGKPFVEIHIGGGTNAPELASATANLNASNNVGVDASAGVDVEVSPVDFTTDGTGFEGSAFLPALGGLLDVTGDDTSAVWSLDYGGIAVAAPVKPGARQ